MMRVHEFIVRKELLRSDLLAISSDSSQFVSDIAIRYTTGETEHTVDVKSLLGMLSVPIKAGTTIRLTTRGKDDEEAMHFVFGLFEKYI